MNETCHKLIGTRIGDQTVDLLPEDRRFAQFIPFCQVEQLRIRRCAPEEIGESHREFAIGQSPLGFIHLGLVQVKKTGRGKNHTERGANGDLEGNPRPISWF